MGKRLNRAQAKAQAAYDAKTAWMSSRWDKYGANDPLLRVGTKGFELSDKDINDLASDGSTHGKRLAESARASYDRFKQPSKKTMFGGGFGANKTLPGTKIPFGGFSLTGKTPTQGVNGLSPKFGSVNIKAMGLGMGAAELREYVYGAEAKGLSGDSLGSYLDGKAKEYDADMAAKKEYEEWERGQEAKKVAERVRGEEYERRKTMFGRNSTYRTGVIGITQKANTQQKKLMGA